MVANLRHKIGRADAEEVMMFLFSNLKLDFQNWTFINVHFRKPGVEI